MLTAPVVLVAGGSSRDRCAVPGPVDEPATFFGESNCVRANKELVEGKIVVIKHN